MDKSVDDLKWADFHPSWNQMVVDSLVGLIDDGLELQAKCRLLRNKDPELLECDPRFPILLEQARRELSHLLTDPELSEPNSPWAKMDLEGRHRIWEWAIETLEQGNYQLLWQ